MERKTMLEKAKQIMGRNFIGPEELGRISPQFGILDPFESSKNIPKIPFEMNFLRQISTDYILILGINKDRNGNKLTLNRMRQLFGVDPERSEPCFYNQDWYLKEKFASQATLNFKWYLIRKFVKEDSRGKNPEELLKSLEDKEQFPSALLTAFVFFAYYLLTDGEILWKSHFIWCCDKDVNGDRIYTGRYLDPQGINKNGFNVHRHLSIRPCYGLAPQII